MKRFLTGLLLVLLPAGAQAQINIKTVPVAEGSQFLLFPSRNLGMGGVSIALDDPLLDPFTNPAKGILVDGFRFTSAPVYYGFSIEGNNLADGSGRTLPVGMFVRSGGAFGGGTLAWQELVIPQAGSMSPQNLYAFGAAGFEVPGTDLSLGLSAFNAQLDGVEGVRMLYAAGNDVRQKGTMEVYRAGLYGRWADGRAAELLVLHHRFEMAHMLTPLWASNVQTRHEQDQTRGWAAQLVYRQPVARGWQVGAHLAGDWKWHPKIPNYDLMQIPRDPGNSSAYQIGFGMSRQYGQATIGLDLLYEPIWSHTWADALADTVSSGGCPVPAGEMTVENFFRFNNTQLRMGLQRAGDRVDFALGLHLHAIRYTLEQENFVEEIEREQDERWAEWTFSTGLGVSFPEFQIRYLGLLTLGTGQPFTQRAWPGPWFEGTLRGFSGQADFLVAPNGPLSLQEAMVFTHQLAVIVPLSE